MARGRKRKAGRRHPCGKLVPASVGETQREVVATVLEARQRPLRRPTERQAKDDRLGTALGRAAFAGKITADQYAAGEMYGEIMARNRAVMGLPMDQPRSVAALLYQQGIFGGVRLTMIRIWSRRFAAARGNHDAAHSRPRCAWCGWSQAQRPGSCSGLPRGRSIELVGSRPRQPWPWSGCPVPSFPCRQRQFVTRFTRPSSEVTN